MQICLFRGRPCLHQDNSVQQDNAKPHSAHIQTAYGSVVSPGAKLAFICWCLYEQQNYHWVHKSIFFAEQDEDHLHT